MGGDRLLSRGANLPTRLLECKRRCPIAVSWKFEHDVRGDPAGEKCFGRCRVQAIHGLTGRRNEERLVLTFEHERELRTHAKCAGAAKPN